MLDSSYKFRPPTLIIKNKLIYHILIYRYMVTGRMEYFALTGDWHLLKQSHLIHVVPKRHLVHLFFKQLLYFIWN